MFCFNRLWIAGRLGAGFLLIAACLPAAAMPLDTDRQWLSVGGTYCYRNTPNGTPTCPNVGTASGFLDHTVERADVYWQGFNVSLKGGGSTSASTLKALVAGNSGFARSTAIIEDTYLLTGPAGELVSIEAVIVADGSADIVTRSTGQLNGGAFATVRIGDAMQTDGTDLVSSFAQDTYFPGYVNPDLGLNPDLVHDDFDLRATHALEVLPGTTFDLAFMLEVQATNGAIVDALNTATIDFVLPDGYSLTSVLGFGAASATVSEPAAIVVFATGLAGLLIRRRRRSRL